MDQSYYIPRPDHKTAKKIEQAIHVQSVLDTKAAARYLQERGIDFAVALRVLTRPDRRRASN
jgi:predicted polyphosphate/ATP-dependent NAD kinase